MQSHVHLTSKHCQACQKCVIGFDHHCLWLNCCIGRRNYTPFLTLLALSVLLFSMHLTVSTIHLINSYIHPASLRPPRMPREPPLLDLPLPAVRVRLPLLQYLSGTWHSDSSRI